MSNENQNPSVNPLDDFFDESTFTENPFSQSDEQDFNPFAEAPAPAQNPQAVQAAQIPAQPVNVTAAAPEQAAPVQTSAQPTILQTADILQPLVTSPAIFPEQNPAPAPAEQTQLAFTPEPAAEPQQPEATQTKQPEDLFAAALQNAQQKQRDKTKKDELRIRIKTDGSVFYDEVTSEIIIITIPTSGVIISYAASATGFARSTVYQLLSLSRARESIMRSVSPKKREPVIRPNSKVPLTG